jgi:hypothetical protein
MLGKYYYHKGANIDNLPEKLQLGGCEESK